MWIGVAVILPIPWASAMHLIKSVGSYFLFNQSSDSIEKLKADLASGNQTAELLRQEQPLKGFRLNPSNNSKNQN